MGRLSEKTLHNHTDHLSVHPREQGTVNDKKGVCSALSYNSKEASALGVSEQEGKQWGL